MIGSAPRLALVAALLLGAACVPPPPPPTAPPTASPSPTPRPAYAGRTLAIASGAGGGVTATYGAVLADVLARRLPVDAHAVPTAGAVGSLALLRDGAADLAVVYGETARDASLGAGAFAPQRPLGIHTLAVLYTETVHVVVRADGTRTSVAGLKGARVSLGPPGSGTEQIAVRLVEAAGLDPVRDLRAEHLGIADAAAALRDGRLDAFVWSGIVPVVPIAELAATTRLRFIETASLVPQIVRKQGTALFATTISAASYGSDGPIATSGIGTLLVAGPALDAELTAAITAALFAGRDDLGLVRPEARLLSPATAIVGSPLELDPGAIAFYRSQGVWR